MAIDISVTLFLYLSEGVLYHIGLIHREGKRDEVCNDPRELTGSFFVPVCELALPDQLTYIFYNKQHV